MFRIFLLKCYNVFSYLLFDPIDLLQRYRALPYFLRNLIDYQHAFEGKKFRLKAKNCYVTTADKFRQAGSAGGHYFFQDLWAARHIFQQMPDRHVDVGSRLDGFVAHLLTFRELEYVDIRPLDNPPPGLQVLQGSIQEMPFPDNSIASLSCLHVIEHIGLGRYGDWVDPDGHLKAARELARVLQPGGRLYLGTPVGRERLCFDAHRIFHPVTVQEMFPNLPLTEFSLIDDRGTKIIENATFEQAASCRYGCGLFIFEKPR